MKTYILSIILLIIGSSAACQSTTSANKKSTKKTSTLDSPALKAHNIGYAYGVTVAQQIFPNPLLVMTEEEQDIDAFIQGFKEGIKGNEETSFAARSVLKNRFGNTVPSTTKQEAKKIAYNLGINAISGLSTLVTIPADAINLEAMKTGFKEAEAGKAKMDSIEVDVILNTFREPYQSVIEAKRKERIAAQQKIQDQQLLHATPPPNPNIAAGKAFLATNAKKEGVVTLASGLQYKIIREGTGIQPTIDDRVKTHYHGTTIDGKVFDSSVERGEPATFGVRQVIQGWQEGIPLMKEGAKYILYIPQKLAYGMQSPSADIPAGSTLIFEVELIEVNPKQ